MPDDQAPVGAHFPNARRDVDELVEEGVARRAASICVSLTIDAAGTAAAFGFNGREAAAYVLGQWQRHYRDAVDNGYMQTPDPLALELLAVIRQEHLPAVAAVLLNAGVSADIASATGTGMPLDVITLRLSFRAA